MDFGIAKKVLQNGNTLDSVHSTASEAILGTPEYLSPERKAMGRTSDADVRTDVYILGALLYRLLTGRVPFQGFTLANLLEQIRVSDPVDYRRFKAGIPRPLETICLKCLRLDPRRRLRFCRSARRRPATLGERSANSGEAGGSDRAWWSWCRRRPAVAGLVGAVCDRGNELGILVRLYGRAQTRAWPGGRSPKDR